MAILLDKSGSQLKTDLLESGGSDNMIFFAGSGIATHGKLEASGGDFNSGYFLLGDMLTDTDDFWYQIKFRAPSSWDANVNDSNQIRLGLFNTNTTASNNRNQATMSITYTNDAQVRVDSYILDSGGAQIGTSDTLSLTPNSLYIAEFSYDHSTETFTGTFKDAGGNTLSTISDSTIAGTLTCNAIGVFGIAPTGSTEVYLYSGLIVTSIKLTSTTTDETVPDTDTDVLVGELDIKHPNSDTATDLSEYLIDFTLDRQYDAADRLSMRLINHDNTISALFAPNSRVRFRFGFGALGDHKHFYGYIPPNPDYCNKCSIKGKNVTFTRDNEIDAFGIAHRVIDPVSKESSAQLDIQKAMEYCSTHADPYYPFTQDDTTITVDAFGYVSKLADQLVYYDKTNNLDGHERYTAAYLVLIGLDDSTLRFGGGGSDPRQYLTDSTCDWTPALNYIQDKILNPMKKSDAFPKKARNYHMWQETPGEPYLHIAVEPDLEGAPTVIYEIEESDILVIRPGTQKYSMDIRVELALWLDLNDVVYIDTDQFGLRGYHIISQIRLMGSPDSVSGTIYFDRPSKVK